MERWNFYYSGILYGLIERMEQTWYHKELDPFTNSFSDWKVLNEYNSYQLLCSRDICKLMDSMEEYTHGLAGENHTFTTQYGEVFDKRREDSYIQRHVKFPKDLLVKNQSVYAVLMPGRDYCAVLVRDGMESDTIIADWNAYQANPPLPVQFLGTFQVLTRDGEQLATDVYVPGGVTVPVPCVLIRTPYGKAAGCQQYYRFVQRGYAVIIQDVRGREDSTGEWLPNYYEVEDGDDTLNWIAAQPFSDGQAAMTGGSYLGYVQWAAAASGNPHLKAMLSSVCAGSAFVDVPRRGGCFNSGMLAWAFAMTEQRMRADLMVRHDWEEVLNIRPLKSLAKQALGKDVPFLSKWLLHMDYDELWQRSSWKERSTGVVVPALIMSGWFDDNGMGTTESLDLIKSYPPGNAKVILGPWMHSGNANYDLHGVYLGQDALRYDMDLICFQWIDHFLKGIDNGIESSPPVEYYTVGDNCWKTADAWPVPDAVPTPYYLDKPEHEFGTHASEGTADLFTNTLSTIRPQTASYDSYTYDPANPSTHIIDMSENELEVPENYTEEEKRPDVLCYSTPILEQDLTVTGEILVHLFISSDCPDTDFMVRLTDVDRQGTSIKLADGVISAKYRNSFKTPEFMEPDQIYEIPIRTTKISNTFKQGHRLRFTVTSSAKNFIFPNSNTREGFDSEEIRIAHNKIHRGEPYASYIVLPVVTF